MLDNVAAIYATAYFAAQMGLLIGFSPVRRAAKLGTFAAAWLAMDVIAYTVGGLRPGVLGPVPVNLLSFTLLLALLFGSWFLLPQVRCALISADRLQDAPRPLYV